MQRVVLDIPDNKINFFMEIVNNLGFKKHAKSIAKKHRSLKSDIAKLIDSLEENPAQGEPIRKRLL